MPDWPKSWSSARSIEWRNTTGELSPDNRGTLSDSVLRHHPRVGHYGGGASMKSKALLKPTFFCVLAAFPAMALWGIIQSHHTLTVLSHYFRGKAGTCTLAESFESEAISR